MTKRHSFSDKFKATVALEALRGDKTAQEIDSHSDGDHRGRDGNALDEFAADHRLAGARFCSRCCRTWNWDGPRISGKP